MGYAGTNERGRQMTPDQMQREEQHASLMAVAHSLSDAERVHFLAEVARRWPRMQGAQVADVLDTTADHDMFLDQTEPFFEKFGDQMPDGLNYAPLYAAHVIIILGQKLDPARVAYRLQRAGVLDAPRYPDVTAGLWANDQGEVRDVNHLLLMARAEQGMRAAGVPERVITEFRGDVRHTDIPGYSRNISDIAKWVTLVEGYTALPRKIYDPVHDVAVALMHASFYESDGGEVARSMANLSSHLDMRAVETIEAGLRGFFHMRDLYTEES